MNKKLVLFFSFFMMLIGISSTVQGQTQIVPVLVRGESYFSIDAVSRNEGLNFHWDPFLKNVTVSTLTGSVKFHVDSEYILDRDKLIKLGDKVLYLNGEVLAPLSASQYLKKLIPSSAIKETLPMHRIKRVVIDAGHGGHDFGAMSPGGIKEKELALKMAKLIAEEFRQTGIEVILTRQDDTFIPLDQRSKLSNEARADFFISVHANASTSESLKGFEVYYLSDAVDDLSVALEHAENASLPGSAQVSEPSKDLNAIYWDLAATENRRESIKAAEAVTGTVQRLVDIGARRVRSAQFRVLKWANAPSMLIEIGYLTNTEDELRLADPLYQKRLARAVVSGFLNYKMEFERTNGFTK